MSGWILALLFAVVAQAQDSYSALPKNYSLEWENEFVRVSRVKFLPGDKLPVHSHPALPTVYIYLTDGGRIQFIHKTPAFTLERPPVKAGGVRFNRNAQVETHEVVYLGEAATEYLRVELKTTPGPRHRDARLRDAGDFPWEDEQIRISRVQGTPPKLDKPAVVVSLSSRTAVWADAGKVSEGSGEFVVVELKTAGR